MWSWPRGNANKADWTSTTNTLWSATSGGVASSLQNWSKKFKDRTQWHTLIPKATHLLEKEQHLEQLAAWKCCHRATLAQFQMMDFQCPSFPSTPKVQTGFAESFQKPQTVPQTTSSLKSRTTTISHASLLIFHSFYFPLYWSKYSILQLHLLFNITYGMIFPLISLSLFISSSFIRIRRDIDPLQFLMKVLITQ